MTKLDERVSLEMEMDLMVLFSESTPCEVDSHAEQPHLHEGDGEWYLIGSPCEYCGEDAEVILICDKFKKVLDASMENGNVPCRACRRRRMVRDIIVRFERKDKA